MRFLAKAAWGGDLGRPSGYRYSVNGFFLAELPEMARQTCDFGGPCHCKPGACGDGAAMTIEKVLFDLGNVLLRFDFSRAYREMAAHGARLEALTEDAMVALVIEYETGLISTEEMFERVSAHVGYRGTRAHFEKSWQEIFEVNEPMVEFLESLNNRGIPCFLLSNSNDLHVRHIKERYRVLEPFEDIIFSHEAGAMKPGEAIYGMAIERFGLDPAKTAYIDDLPDNIATGGRLGFQCVHYHPDEHEKAESELTALGLIPS